MAGYSFSKTNTSHWGTVSNATANSLGTADFCVESWVYVNNFSGSYSAPVLWCKANSTPVGWFGEISASTIWFGIGGTAPGTNYTQWSYSFPTGQWVHVAFTRTGTSLNCFVNGVGLGANTVTGAGAASDNTNAWIIGAYSISGSYHINGYISNLRVTKGTRRYTSNFTPPTSALTADGDTVLLTAQSAIYIDNSSTGATVASTGAGFTISTLNPFPDTYVATGGASCAGDAGAVQKYAASGGAACSGDAIVEQHAIAGVKCGGSSRLRWCSCELPSAPSGVVICGGSTVSRPNPYDAYYAVLPLDEQAVDGERSFQDRCNDNDGTSVGELPVSVAGALCHACNYFENSLVILPDYFPSDDLTVSCLVRPVDQRKGAVIYGQSDVACGLSFTLIPRAIVDTDFWAENAARENQWAHLAFRFSGASVSIFRNGVLEATDTYVLSGNSSLPVIGQQYRDACKKCVSGQRSAMNGLLPSLSPYPIATSFRSALRSTR